MVVVITPNRMGILRAYTDGRVRVAETSNGYNLFKALNPEASHVLVAREADHAFHGTVGHTQG
jgi:hypothetical protein